MITLILSLLLISPSASADGAPCERACGSATGAGKQIAVAVSARHRVPGRGPGEREAARTKASSYSYVEERAAPMCSGNSLASGDGLCQAALSTCPQVDEIRYWVWHRTVDVVVGPPRVATPRAWTQEVGTFCLGPQDPGVPLAARVVAMVQADFARRLLPLPVWPVRSDPGPRTLVNFPTSFSAGTAAPVAINRTILGVPVHVTAVPQQWSWNFGDHTTLTTAYPGRAKTDDLVHPFTALGGRTVQVSVAWGGTFRIGTDPTEYTLRTPAVVPGTPGQVRVLEAHAERVAG